jgi:inorganic pyrophosphatase
MKSLHLLPPFHEGSMQVVVETPRGSDGKFTFDPEVGAFRLTGWIPKGMHFPYDFGFVPSTLGGDGDPLDILVLNDMTVPMGCLLQARLIGVLEARQTEKGKTEKNDRLIAVEINSTSWRNVREARELPASLREQLELFFVAYNQIKRKKFKPIRWGNSSRASQVLAQAAQKFSTQKKEPKASD